MSPPRALRAPTQLRGPPLDRLMSPPNMEKRSTVPQRRLVCPNTESSDPAPLHLVSYRLDTPTHPLVSLRERRCSVVKCLGHLRPRRVPGLVDFGWKSLPDVSAKEWFPPIRLPRKPWLPRDNAEPWTVSSTQRRSLDRHTQRVASTHPAPKDLLHVNRCGSMTEMFGAIVDVRSHRRVATTATRPACSPRCSGTGDRSNQLPTNLVSSPIVGGHDTGGHGRSHNHPALHKSQTGLPFAHRARHW